LWEDFHPHPTNLWAVQKVRIVESSSGRPIYFIKQGRDNGEVLSVLSPWVKRLPKGSLRRWLEEDYLGKYWVFRNWYTEVGMRNQAEVAPWFNFQRRKVAKGYFGYLVDFWRKLVEPTYKPLTFGDVSCPKNCASTGLALSSEGWIYQSNAGDYWDRIADASEEVWDMLRMLAPTWDQLGDPRYRNPALELLSLDTPVIRTESGPDKIRWAQSHGKHLYILERMYIEPLQARYNDLPTYIGKASHCGILGRTFEEWDGKPVIGTHGDDWVALGKGWSASGDWSNFDLHVEGIQVVLAYKALSQVLKETARGWTDDWDGVLRSLCYIASKGPTIWPWAKVNGKLIRRVSVRRLEGHVRSGKGDFVLHNNAMNTAALRKLFERGFLGWKRFSKEAREQFGWWAKPTAQKLSTDGFVACRTLFLREADWKPWPCASSVLRNWCRPAYDPLDFPNNTQITMAVRSRELNLTLGYLPDFDYEKLFEAVLLGALEAGVRDPLGSTFSEAELARVQQKLSSDYSLISFLES
jgi:hypothetical protein